MLNFSQKLTGLQNVAYKALLINDNECIIWLVAGMLDLNFPLQKIVNTFLKSESLQDVISGGETSNLIFFDQISLRICTLYQARLTSNGSEAGLNHGQKRF